MKAFIKENL